jgi:hypothetical protein
MAENDLVYVTGVGNRAAAAGMGGSDARVVDAVEYVRDGSTRT